MKANGDVLFLSPESASRVGTPSIPKFNSLALATLLLVSNAIFSKTLVSSLPKKIEIIAGGASCPPNL